MAAQKGNREYGEESERDAVHVKRSLTGTIVSNTGNSQFYNKFGITLHNTSIDESQSEASEITHRKSSSSVSVSSRSVMMKKITNLDECGTKFPKLEECAHFHYDFVELGSIQVSLSNENQENHSDPVFYIDVTSRDKTWTISRSYDNLRTFDRQLHKCIFDRKFSLLPELRKNELTEEGIPAMKKLLVLYLNRFTSIAGNMINCGPVLSWLELDNRGNRLIISDDSAINTPAVGAAHVIKRYSAQERDEISLEVGDIISIIDMPPKEESQWWRGKKRFEVGFFPAECVELIREKLPQAVTSKCTQSKPKPVLHKHGKLISLLRSFFSSRPARTQLKRSGIMKERVFGCDLGEHLLNTGREIPLVLERCAETIEQHGIVDGIYRLSGVASNIQKLRNEFDEERVPCLTDECYLQDIHSISSLLKAYFRDLPNPLFTFQLYDKFLAAIQDEENKLIQIHDVIQQLPPPHYRTAKYLMNHLQRISHHGRQTGMHCKNLAIVWAPNLLRSKDLELVCSTAALQGVGVQAIVTEYLISHADLIFSDQLQHLSAVGYAAAGSLPRGRPKSLALSTPTKLLSLEEARAMVNTGGASPKQNYIEVGGGPASLPDKYHTVIDLPSKKKSRKDRKSPSGWRSLFSKKGQGSKGKENERSDSVDSVSSGGAAMAFQDDSGYDPHNGTGLRKLRSVRSADSLLNETNRQPTYSRLSDDDGCGTTFVNPYADGYQPKLRKQQLLSGVDSQRSMSANNSYSESEMEPILDVSPRDEVFFPSEVYGELERVLEPAPESGSLPALTVESNLESTSRPRSQLFVSGELSSEPLMAKRSKSTTIGQHVDEPCFEQPIPTQQCTKNNNVVKESARPKGKVTSPAKRKKAKAPLPPVAPPRLRNTVDAVERNTETLEVLVTVDLTESPGVKRKLLYSGNVELEPDGLEGAPGQLASCDNSFTDDEAFNTHNLSLTTDSETEVEKREALSTMDFAQDNTNQLISDQSLGPAGMIVTCTEATQKANIRDGEVPSCTDYDPLCRDVKSRDGSDLMEKSLDTILKDASDMYYSSDDVSQEAAAASYADLIDSNSDGQVSGATMSTNFTTSSELPCTSSTSEEDVTSREVYAISLSCSAHRQPLFKPLVDYDTSSQSDTNYSREQTTPVVTDPPVPFPNVYTPSDSDTEVARTPDPCSPVSDQGEMVNVLPHIDLAENEVIFVDPDALRSPISDDVMPEGEPDEGLVVVESDLVAEPKVARPEHLSVLAAASVEQVSDLSPYSDSSDQIISDLKPVARLTQACHQKSSDGYLADRSCSASPAFVDSKDAQGKKTYQKDQDDDDAMGLSALDTVKEVTSDEQEHLGKTQTSPEVKTNSSQSFSDNKDLKKSSDSLLFEMEDLDSTQQRSFETSAHRLDASSENDDEFFCPRAADKPRSETKMSVSPELYLETGGKSEQKFDDIPRPASNTSDQCISSQTVTHKSSSVTEINTDKHRTELCRKQSVRELLSKFESSAQSGESSDDGARSSGSDVTGQKTGKISIKKGHDKMIETTVSGPTSVSPQHHGSVAKYGILPRKTSEDIGIRIRAIHSGYSSSEDSDPVRSRSWDHSAESSLCEQQKSDAISDKELSSSPRIQDLRRRFEQKEMLEKAERENKQLKKQADMEVMKCDDHSKVDADVSASDRQQETEILSDMSKQNLTVGLMAPSSSVITDTHQMSSDSVFGSARLKRSTLSERLQTLSEQFRTYSDEIKTAEQNKALSQTEQTKNEQRARPVPKPRSRTHRKPLTKGHFTRYDSSVTKEPEPQTDNVSSSGSGNEAVITARKPSTNSLFERRRKFESFGAADRQGKPSCDDTSKEDMTTSCSLPESQGDIQPDITSSFIQSVDTRMASDQTEGSNQKAAEYKATTLPRHSSTRQTNPEIKTENAEKKHVSVRDLSRQFERQLSEQSDTSRTSTLSRSSGWSCASDLANGNRTLDVEQTNQNSLNRNSTTQNWTTIL